MEELNTNFKKILGKFIWLIRGNREVILRIIGRIVGEL